MNRKDFMKAEREATRQIGDRSYAIISHPWRFRRNRRFRAEIRAILAESDRRWEQYKRQMQARDTPATREQADPDTGRQ